jgi:hypothetical protein
MALMRLSVTHFDGSDRPRAQLPEGPTRAFNLMLRGEAEGELMARPLNGSMWLPCRQGWQWFVHLLAGRAEVQAGDQHTAIDVGASLWIDVASDERTRIEGGGELILVQLRNAEVSRRLG